MNSAGPIPAGPCFSPAASTAQILEVTSYPPPRAGWGIRVEFLKKALEVEGHRCVILNIGTSRMIPSDEYETVLSGSDFVRKVWRYSRRGFVVHAHANGDALKGLALALLAEVINLACGRRCYLTFHAGVIQRYFPRENAWWLVPAFWLLFVIPRRIICNSEAVKAKIQEYGVSGSKIVPIAAFSTQYLAYTPTTLAGDVEAFFARYPHVIFTYVRMRPLFYPLTLVDGLARLVSRRQDVGLVLCGISGHMEEALWDDVQKRIREHRLESHICTVDDLDHDAFLTALQRSTLYLRTPITDGVAASVLEALALGVPVVACENNTRPPGVITYPAEDAEQLADRLEYVIAHRAEVLQSMTRMEVTDTLAHEVELLTAEPRV
jgi:glycosyltransferase involved in cell wall biosynthesis